MSDLALYDDELERALAIVADANPGLPVVLAAHSTGGLIVPLWLNRRRAAGRVAPVAGLVLNSPWFDLQGKPALRGPVTQALRVLSKAQPMRLIKGMPGVYGRTLHTSGTGEWDFDVALKPLDGFPVTMGWLNAIRRGHAQLHRGLDVGVPSLVLRLHPVRLLSSVHGPERPRPTPCSTSRRSPAGRAASAVRPPWCRSRMPGTTCSSPWPSPASAPTRPWTRGSSSTAFPGWSPSSEALHR